MNGGGGEGGGYVNFFIFLNFYCGLFLLGWQSDWHPLKDRGYQRSVRPAGGAEPGHPEEPLWDQEVAAVGQSPPRFTSWRGEAICVDQMSEANRCQPEIK